MTILIIRKHQRFAVRHQVSLVGAEVRPRSGLLVEVSLEGCRLALSGSNASNAIAVEQPVSVRIGGFGTVKATVRWAGDGSVGLRFDAPLHNAELGQLIEVCRPMPGSEETLRAYGT